MKTSSCISPRTRGDEDTTPVEIDVADAVLDHRQQHAAVELEHVVRDTRGHDLDRSERATGLLHDFEPDQLKGVVLVLGGRRQRVPLDLECPCHARRDGRAGSPAGRMRCDRRPRPRHLPARKRAPVFHQRPSSLACSTTNEPSRPCGLPTRPIRTLTPAGSPAARSPRRASTATSRFSSTKP